MTSGAADTRFISLCTPRRVWAVPSIHADLPRLIRLHDALIDRIGAGDRLVYLGNYTGYGQDAVQTVDELLAFRRQVLAVPGFAPEDIVYLRGRQEDLWHKLMQLPFAPNPVDQLLWMLSSGLEATLSSYGVNAQEGVVAAREGVMPLTRWINKIRQVVRCHPGHEKFGTQFRRAAFTQYYDRFPLLFVNAGINPDKPLSQQDDCFYWSGEDFTALTTPYDPFEKVVRGFDPQQEGVRLNCVTASIDGGCGFGGSLVCAGMDYSGAVFEMLEA